VGWDGEGRERKGEEGRDGKRAGGEVLLHGCWGGWTPLLIGLAMNTRVIQRHPSAGSVNQYRSLRSTTRHSKRLRKVLANAKHQLHTIRSVLIRQ
jgi:hypothetical protein